MDAAGFRQATLFALSEGGPAAIVFAATRPKRTRALILSSTLSYTGMVDWISSTAIRPNSGHVSCPSWATITHLRWSRSCASRNLPAQSARHGAAVPRCRLCIPSVPGRRASWECWSAWGRAPGWPGPHSKLHSGSMSGRYRPTITVPTLVVHARDDVGIPVQCGRYLADHIPGARYLEVDGTDHAPWFTEPETIIAEIEEFLTGGHAAPSQSHRALRTVLFTDIVASTQHAATAGDECWRAVIERFGQITAELAERFGGTVVKSTGDGHLTTFDGPTQAIRCAEAFCAVKPKNSASRSASASIPASVNCSTPTSGVSPCISRPESRGRRWPAKSSSPARSVTWSSVRARASRTAATSNCVVCPAHGNSWRSSTTARGRDRPRRNLRQGLRPAHGARCAGRTAPSR